MTGITSVHMLQQSRRLHDNRFHGYKNEAIFNKTLILLLDDGTRVNKRDPHLHRWHIYIMPKGQVLCMFVEQLKNKCCCH